jgi:catechol 2,3-dioxygenase-like lactoylglutathione lyase family enzyme
VTELFHVGLCVSDLEKSIAFYRSVTHMEVVEKHVRASQQFDLLSGNSGTEVRVAYLGDDDGFRLQLIEYARGGGGRAAVAHNRAGSSHLSFFVDDVQAEFARLTNLPHVRVTSPVVVLSPHMTSFYTADPDDVPVELLELTKPLPGVAERRRGR